MREFCAPGQMCAPSAGMFVLLALLAAVRAQANCTGMQIASLAPRTAVVPTALLTLSVNVTGFGMTRVTESGSDDDVAMEFSNLTLAIPLKSDVLSALRLPNETAQASVALGAPAVCDLREWGSPGRISPAIARVLVSRAAVDLQALVGSAVERIPFASWSGPAVALRVVAFERDASQDDCRYVAGDDDLANTTFTNQLCAVENAVCATTIGANMDGWEVAGHFEFRLAPSWTVSGSRRSLVLTQATFVDVVPLASVAVTRTSSAPYEFVAINATAGAGIRFHLDADANLVRYLHCGSLVLASTGSVVQLRFTAPFDASRNADRRIADGVYNVSLGAADTSATTSAAQ
jgi:hypothetical protein